MQAQKKLVELLKSQDDSAIKFVGAVNNIFKDYDLAISQISPSFIPELKESLSSSALARLNLGFTEMQFIATSKNISQEMRELLKQPSEEGMFLYEDQIKILAELDKMVLADKRDYLLSIVTAADYKFKTP